MEVGDTLCTPPYGRGASPGSLDWPSISHDIELFSIRSRFTNRMIKELTFIVEEAEEGGYTAHNPIGMRTPASAETD